MKEFIYYIATVVMSVFFRIESFSYFSVHQFLARIPRITPKEPHEAKRKQHLTVFKVKKTLLTPKTAKFLSSVDSEIVIHGSGAKRITGKSHVCRKPQAKLCRVAVCVLYHIPTIIGAARYFAQYFQVMINSKSSFSLYFTF